jgi:hypothetical protein
MKRVRALTVWWNIVHVNNGIVTEGAENSLKKKRNYTVYIEDVQDVADTLTNGRCNSLYFGCLPAARVLTALT